MESLLETHPKPIYTKDEWAFGDALRLERVIFAIRRGELNSGPCPLPLSLILKDLDKIARKVPTIQPWF